MVRTTNRKSFEFIKLILIFSERFFFSSLNLDCLIASAGDSEINSNRILFHNISIRLEMLIDQISEKQANCYPIRNISSFENR